VAAAIPPGGTRDPSSRRVRLPIAAGALAGACVATYLALVQVGIAPLWDPIFGGTARRVLFSALSRALPVPDAALGAFAYVVELALDLAGGEARWHDAPWLVLAFGAVAAALAVTGITLALLQPLAFHAGCTLCLASAAISISLAIAARREVAAAAAELSRHRRPERAA
jgi:uncharacterized membrane protein